MTDQHVSVEHLAAYAAGDLDASAALEVEAHVLLCPDCRADVLAVQRVTTDLAAVQQVTMPADVAARVDATLARERSDAGARPAAQDGGGAGPVGDVLPMVRRRRVPSFAGITAVAAGVALVAAISVPLVTGGGGGGGGGGGAADSAGSSQAQAPEATVTTRRLESGLDYRAASVEAVLQHALSGERDAQFATQKSAAVASGSEESGSAADKTAPEPAPAVAAAELTTRAALATLQAPPRLAACLASLADSQPGIGRTPLLVDFAEFEGRPALIVVFPTVSRGEIRPDKVDFWAVGPGCGTARGDDDAMHFARIDRPPGL